MSFPKPDWICKHTHIQNIYNISTDKHQSLTQYMYGFHHRHMAVKDTSSYALPHVVNKRFLINEGYITNTITSVCSCWTIQGYPTDLAEMFLLELFFFQGLFLLLFSGSSPPFWTYGYRTQAQKVRKNAYINTHRHTFLEETMLHVYF